MLEVPSETELIEFFGVAPIESAPEDGYWCYELRVSQAATIRFSFNIFEQSVQTVYCIGDESEVIVSHEGAISLEIANGRLHCAFTPDSSVTVLEIAVNSRPIVRWSNLRVR